MYSDTTFPSPDGVAVSLEAFGRGLQQLGTDVEVIAPRQLRSGTILTRPIASIKPPGRDYHVGLVFPWSKSSRASAARYDIVHVHTLGPVGLAGMKAAHSARIPAVLTWHTDLIAYRQYYPEIRLGLLVVAATLFSQTTSARGGRSSLNQRTITRRLLSAFDRIIVPSSKAYHQVRRLGALQHIDIIPNPTLPLAPPRSTTTELRYNLKIPANSEVVLSVGRLSKEKNLTCLLRAFSILKSRHPNVQLVLVGPSRGDRHLVGLARALGVLDSVHITGLVERDLLGAYYSLSHIFVLPSLSETQSLAAIEAAAFGLPVIVVDSDLDNAFEDHHRVVAESSPPQLARHMNDCLDEVRDRPTPGYPTMERYRPTILDQSKKLIEVYSSLMHVRDGTTST